MTDLTPWARWLRWLRKKFPSQIPVRVYLVPKVEDGCLGICIFCEDTKRAVIHVRDSLSESQTRDTLFEEWAHLLRYHLDQIGDSEKHDEIYGVLFNQIKRAWDD